MDLDTDDVEAEVRRLEALGAQRLEQYGDYWQMADPGGSGADSREEIHRRRSGTGQ